MERPGQRLASDSIEWLQEPPFGMPHVNPTIETWGAGDTTKPYVISPVRFPRCPSPLAAARHSLSSGPGLRPRSLAPCHFSTATGSGLLWLQPLMHGWPSARVKPPGFRVQEPCVCRMDLMVGAAGYGPRLQLQPWGTGIAALILVLVAIEQTARRLHQSVNPACATNACRWFRPTAENAPCRPPVVAAPGRSRMPSTT